MELEQFKTALGENPEFKEGVLKTLEEGYVIRSKEDQQTYEANLKTQISDDEYKRGQVDAYNNVDSNVKELTSVERAESEKTSEYVARALKAKVDTETTELKGTIETLQKEGGNEELVTQLKERLANVETTFKDERSMMQKKIDEANSELFKTRIDSRLDSAALTLKPTFDKKYDDSALGKMINAEKMEFHRLYQVVERDGRTVLLDQNGKEVLNPTTFEPITPEEKYTEMMQYLVDKGRKVEGTGGEGGERTPDKVINGLPADVTNQRQLLTFLLEKGFSEGSEDFNKEFDKYKVGLPIGIGV